MPDGHEILIAGHDQASASFRQFTSLPVHIRASDPGRTPHHDLIVALQPSATEIVRHEQIVIIPMPEDERSFHRIHLLRRD